MGFTRHAEGGCGTATAQRRGEGKGNHRLSARNSTRSGAGSPEGGLGRGEARTVNLEATTKTLQRSRSEQASKGEE